MARVTKAQHAAVSDCNLASFDKIIEPYAAGCKFNCAPRNEAHTGLIFSIISLPHRIITFSSDIWSASCVLCGKKFGQVRWEAALAVSRSFENEYCNLSSGTCWISFICGRVFIASFWRSTECADLRRFYFGGLLLSNCFDHLTLIVVHLNYFLLQQFVFVKKITNSGLGM